ncbi:MAG: glycosyltransferase [Planctomycetota bacterium]|nr:glycosyltransferase [Planctomycetota bacterium]
MLLVCLYTAVSTIAAIVSFLLLLHAWEHRRYTRNKLREIDASDCAVQDHVTVIVPCKGLDLDLDENLRRLMSQDYPSYDVIFVVDSLDDPACDVIRDLMQATGGVSTRLVNAGPATDTGQKIHNLLAATDAVGENAEILAFVDSDARPNRNWLRHLVSNLNRPGFDAVTSYRWFIPRRATVGNLVLYSINSAVMALTATRRPTLLWGGTWAIRRSTFEQIGLRLHWRRKLSDDLAASALFSQTGIRVSFEPRCIVASPIDFSTIQMWEFLRRQYYMGRWYRAGIWWLCLATISVTVTAFWSSVAMLFYGISTAAAWTWLPAVVAATLYGFAAVRARWRQQASLRYGLEETSSSRIAKWFDVVAFPFTMLVAWAGMVSSIANRRTTWRGIQYYVGKGGCVEIVKPTSDRVGSGGGEHQRAA